MRRAPSSTSTGEPESKPFTATSSLGEGFTSSGSVLPERVPYRFQTASSNPNRTEGAVRSSPLPGSPYGSTHLSSISRSIMDAASRRSCDAASTELSPLKPGSGAVSPQPSEPSSPDNRRRRPSRRLSVVPSNTNGREKGRL